MAASARVIRVDDPDEVVDVFCEAFRDYPVMRFTLGPGRSDFERDLRTLIGFFVMARALRCEYLFGIRGANGLLEAAATVSRPGAPMPEALAALRDEVWSELGADARARYEAYGAAQAQFERPEPHLHLNMLGVRRALKGRGLGRALLDHVHALSRDDPSSTGVTLATEDPANVALYRHVGYVVTGQAVVSPELRTWALYRPD
jgi:ribosomal protein S18 acetylase RimI-like enzyme